jgi:tetratricopeptide (TPR) repeat protein
MGGEPTLHPLFVHICVELTKYNRIWFSTNNSISFDRLKQFILSVNKDNVSINCSLQSIDESGERFNGFVERVKLLTESGFSVNVSFVAVPDRFEKLPLYQDVFGKIGVRFLPQPLDGNVNGKTYPADYSTEEKTILDNTSDQVAMRYVTKKGDYPCPYGKVCGFIHINGENGVVTQCGWGEALGNIYEEQINQRKIWRICPYNKCSCPHIPWSTDIRAFPKHPHSEMSKEEYLVEYAKVADNPFFDGIRLNPGTPEEKKNTIKILELAEQKGKMFTAAYLLQGNLYHDTGEYDAAFRSYKKAIRSDPLHGDNLQEKDTLEKEVVDEQLAVADKIIKKLNNDTRRSNLRSSRLSTIINTYMNITELADEELFLLSELFSEEWYLEIYDDIANAGGDPIKHYLEQGWREGRDPSSLFSTVYYLDNNPDVKAAEINPLVHYLRWGKEEGRLITPSLYRRYFL